MKTIALIVIITTLTSAGLLAAHRLKKRVALLEKCIVMVNAIQTEIEFLLLPTAEIITSLTSRTDLSDLKFLQCCEAKMNDGIDFKSAWNESVCDSENSFFFKKSDVEILTSFSELFGVTDREGQFLNCRLYCEKIQLALTEAKQSRDKYSKLLSSLGILAGLYILVVFI